MFAPDAGGLVDAASASLRRARAAPAAVLRPFDPQASGSSGDATWPGEGQYRFARGGIPTASYITGPTYLLSWGIAAVDKVDHRRMRAQAMAFTEMILRLGRTPARELDSP